MAEVKVKTVKFNVNAKNMQTLYDLAMKVNNDFNEADQQKFLIRYREIDRLKEQMEDCFYYLSAVTSSDKQDYQKLESMFNNFEEMYYSVQVIYDSFIKISTNKQKPCTSTPEFRLPKITLSTFSGVYTEWPSFIALFNSLIHGNGQLSNVHKMHYLISVLDKEPLSLVKHLELSDQNYIIAYNILQDRYENKRFIADRHLEAILNLHNISSSQQVHQLRKFTNTLKENTQALTALGFDVRSWSFLLLHIFIRKLPVDLRSKFEGEHINHDPTFDNLLQYLENQLKVLESVASGSSSKSTMNNICSSKLTHLVNSSVCVACKQDHNLYSCPMFNNMKPTQRKQLVMDHRLCFNCLRPHPINKCLSKVSCRVCHGRHHTKLHIEPELIEAATNSAVCNSTVSTSQQNGVHQGSTMLLGTAIVGICDVNGHIHHVRALLDSGSQVSIVTETLAQKLRLPRSASGTLHGLGGSSTQHTNGSIDCTISSLTNNQENYTTSAIVLKRITSSLPTTQISSQVARKCRDMMLADPKFDIPGPIDILIGVDLYNNIFDDRKLHLGDGLPIALGSVFGWVLMGKSPAVVSTNTSTTFTCTLNLDSLLTRFWEVEEAPKAQLQDPDNLLCEKHFIETHTRDSTGRFILRLPFKSGSRILGETHSRALKRFHNLERKLLKDDRLRQLYNTFMSDYLDAGHMRPIPFSLSKDRYFIPHHGVIKESSSTTKLRAVFDASAASSTGVSLNQVLLSGPKLQQDITNVIMRFRTHAVVFTCDIRQMYRQVRLHNDDCRYQTIFWRASPDLPLQMFELATVTYGVTSAAYLAIRVIHELASLNQSSNPEAASVLMQDTFVDDVITGSHDVTSARSLQKQLVEVLAQGGFQLRKWASNSSELLDGYPSEHLESPFRFEESGDNVFKILGIEWSSGNDSFIFPVAKPSRCRTKREILSNIARIYDPCGFLTPITFFAKNILQRLWVNQLSWDDQLPEEISNQWDSFAGGFSSLEALRLPRRISCDQPIQCDLIGFSDASEKGYAAVAYLRVVDSDGEVSVHLLLAKSRVAPTKQKLTVPRLELSGAVLLARLLSHTLKILQERFVINEAIAFCDSNIVLAWIRTPPHKLQTFEGNRITQIMDLIPSASWRHVPSALNPADCASRGLLPPELVNHHLWWSPSWLMEDPSCWPQTQPALCEDLLGLKTVSLNINTGDEVTLDLSSLISNFSSLSCLQRVVGWCLRFIRNVREPANKMAGPLCVKELDNALHRLVKSAQRETYSEEIELIKSGKPVKASVARLHPFLDSEGYLRVGGRLRHSLLHFRVKHPLLLPKAHHLTNLIIDYYHQAHLHVGLTALLNILHERFWIPSARRVVKHRIFLCHRCHRLRAKPSLPFMGDLPPSRVRPSRPFLKVGVDFAGPFLVKFSTARNAKVQKAYLCVFVCFTTKAAHLEVVSKLSTDAFMACFHRFISRRGIVSDIYSDCGKNFQGAKRLLCETNAFLKANNGKIATHLASAHVNWHMNPPYSPHMGGLWEACVKSAKQLLKRTIGERVLTFEELATVFARIEAVLNSRPLCPLSDSPDDLESLTPGHFLIGQPLISLPEPHFDDTPISTLKRWRLVQQISQHVWRRWQHEYLHNLQQRNKWYKDTPNLQLGDLVLIKDDNLPPLQWRKGRVIKLLPGSDGVVRVVELKTSKGPCLRSVAKICLLPMSSSIN